MRNNKSIIKNAILKILLTIVNLAVPLIAGPHLARTLDVQYYAVYNQSISLLAWFIPLATFGIYNYGIREISLSLKSKDKIEYLFSSFFYIEVIFTLITTIIYLFCVRLFINPIFSPIYYLVAIELVGQMFYIEWVNEAFENYYFIFAKTLVIKLLYLVLVFTFVKTYKDILIFTSIAAGAVFLNYFSSFLYVIRKIKFRKIKFRELLLLLKPLSVMLVLTNANLLFTFLDRLCIVLFSDIIIYSSYYQFSLSIVTVITQVINSIIIVTIPRLSFYLANKQYSSYSNLLKSSLHIYLMLGFPLCVGLSILAKEAIFLYGGIRYIEAWNVLRLFSIRTILCLIDRIFATQILFINSKEKLVAKYYLIGGFINLILDGLLVVLRILTPENLIITTIISEIILVIHQFISLKYLNSCNKNAFDRQMLLYGILALLFIPIYYIFSIHFPFEPVFSWGFIIRILSYVLICIFYYFISLFLLKDPYLCYCKNIVIKKISRLLNNSTHNNAG